jgi:nitroimidazol reductase NimA-like FMN-containing flavoprotein (pyridoxamine 5'-phosphate oxidase superfamily)
MSFHGNHTSIDDEITTDRLTSEMLDLPRHESLRLLAANRFGRLAVAMAEGAPVIRPVNYAFDEPSQSVVFRTSDGSKLHAVLHTAEAAFEIDGIDECSRTGWSVIVRGVAEEVTNPSDIRHLDALGLAPWAPGNRRRWVRIRAWTVSGRRIVLSGRTVANRLGPTNEPRPEAT